MQIGVIHWAIFVTIILILLSIDLFLFNKKSHTIKTKEALIWSGIWIFLAIIFNIFVFIYLGNERGFEFTTGYLLEKSLSVDNIFVFLLLFNYFGVNSKYQHKVLFWGIIGAIVMRAILIVLGAALVSKFHWILYIFGTFLLFTGIKMIFQKDEKIEPHKNPIVKLFKKFFPTKSEYVNGYFFVKENGKYFATPLFIVLLIVETTDLIFAFDSIPAILSITQDSFIVFTSNIFAILGLRSLYFALANFINKFYYLKYGLAIVLAFIGLKMLIVDIYHIHIVASLVVVVLVISISIVISVLNKK